VHNAGSFNIIQTITSKKQVFEMDKG
jgi:hypothetical protein